MDASGILQSLKNNPVALALSVALHVVLFAILAFSLSSSEVPVQKAQKKETVKAFVVDAEVVEQEIKKLKQAEDNKKKKIKDETDKLQRQLKKEKDRLAKIKKQKKEQERKALEKKKLAKKKELIRKKAEAEKKKALLRKKIEDEKRAEIARLAEIKRQQEELAAEKRRREEEIAAEKRRQQEEIAAEKRRQEEEKELKRRMEEEEIRLAKHNDMLASLRGQYVRLIEQKVERNWLRPATVNSEFQCEVFVTQSVLGDVINVRLGACANDIVFRNSIERAVRKSSPLPPPPNPEVFDREIRFVFKPDG